MGQGDGLDAAYKHLASAILLRAARDLKQGKQYAQEARMFLLSEGGLGLASGLGLDVEKLGIWVQLETRKRRRV